MAIFRVEKNDDYSVVSNYHYKEKEMSLKAKGLLSEMLSLKEDWDYSSRGLAAINKEGKNTINKILQELENFNYLVRNPIKNETGLIIDWEYIIYEKPFKIRCTKNEDMENEDMENWYNNKILNNKILTNNKKEKINKKEIKTIDEESVMGHLPSKDNFIKPSINEIEIYIKQLSQEYLEFNRSNPDKQQKRLPTFTAEQFYDYYESNGWYVGKRKMKNWKATVRNWTRNDFRKEKNESAVPQWFNENLSNTPMDSNDIEELDSILKEIEEGVESM